MKAKVLFIGSALALLVNTSTGKSTLLEDTIPALSENITTMDSEIISDRVLEPEEWMTSSFADFPQEQRIGQRKRLVLL
ncbi:MAG: hypothetical protein GY790_00940 [Bacteroidetes bacterium]|nr:hypothetical protein [Bacteroidota bacterium]